jgi:hypothetical protein
VNEVHVSLKYYTSSSLRYFTAVLPSELLLSLPRIIFFMMTYMMPPTIIMEQETITTIAHAGTAFASEM